MRQTRPGCGPACPAGNACQKAEANHCHPQARATNRGTSGGRGLQQAPVLAEPGALFRSSLLCLISSGFLKNITTVATNRNPRVRSSKAALTALLGFIAFRRLRGQSAPPLQTGPSGFGLLQLFTKAKKAVSAAFRFAFSSAAKCARLAQGVGQHVLWGPPGRSQNTHMNMKNYKTEPLALQAQGPAGGPARRHRYSWQQV
jgi:hypothetical protein